MNKTIHCKVTKSKTEKEEDYITQDTSHHDKIGTMS